jgi:hypothetical protein
MKNKAAFLKGIFHTKDTIILVVKYYINVMRLFKGECFCLMSFLYSFDDQRRFLCSSTFLFLAVLQYYLDLKEGWYCLLKFKELF